MVKRFLLFSFIFFLINISLSGQEKTLPELKRYQNAKIGMLDFNSFDVSNLIIESDSIRFTDKSNYTRKTISLDEVNYLRVQTGTEAGRWAALGGAFAGIIVLGAVIDVSSDPEMEFKPNAFPISMGMIGGGVLLGTMIGSFIPKYKTYYIQNETAFLNNIKPDIYLGQNSMGFSLTININ